MVRVNVGLFVVVQGEEANRLYLVETGACELLRYPKHSDGRVERGKLFGEASEEATSLSTVPVSPLKVSISLTRFLPRASFSWPCSTTALWRRLCARWWRHSCGA
jgi:CRP-like cAMP-binding protein